MSTRYEVTRFALDAGQPYEAFRHRFETAVPPWPQQRFVALVQQGAPWDQVRAEAAALAPQGLFTYWRSEQASLMRLAGERWECTSYLVGNTVIAQRMYHHDPAVMSAIPFHVSISVGSDGRTRLVLDQPSTHLNSFADSAFARIATQVDALLGALLGALDVPVPTELSHPSPPDEVTAA